MKKLVYGVGFNDRKYQSRVNGKTVKQYKLWAAILERCYVDDIKYSSYSGCEVSENFKSYSYFYEWCQDQIGFGKEGYEIDKDILSGGNKIYSEDTCCFVPRSINVLLTNSKATRGDLPVGVSVDKRDGSFYALIRIDGKQKRIGTFKNPIDAFNAYKIEKKKEIVRQAEMHKNFICNKVFDRLMSYDISIDS